MSSLFYQDRRLLVLVILLIAVAGLSSYAVLPRMEDPPVTRRNASISTRFPGADAQRVEALVTEVLEDELSEIKEIKEIRSLSQPGVSLVLVELLDSVLDSDEVWSRIRDEIGDAALRMPQGVSESEFKVEEGRAYALVVALRWEQESAANYAILGRLAESLEDELRAVPGTEIVDRFGAPDEEFLVTVHADELASRGLTTADVARQLAASDTKRSAGMLRGRAADYLLEVDGELDSLAQLERTPIHHTDDGDLVRLGDVADVIKTISQPPTSLALIEGRPAVVLGAHVKQDIRLDRWDTAASATLSRFNSTLPRGIGLNVVFQQNSYVASRLNSLLGSLLMGALAVVAVVLFMMGWRNALVVGATLPLSALMVLAGLRWLDIPIHQMSVTGLIIALGLLIDNAIVMVDEVSSKLRKGRPAAEAVSQSVQYLFVPLLGSTLTTTFAFAPIALMPGPAGEFVGSIAISVILAISSSLFLAMTIVPAFVALLRHAHQKTEVFHWWQSGFSSPWFSRCYRAGLAMVLRRPSLGIAVGMVLPLVGFVKSRHLREQFFPPADRDQFYVELELPNQASLTATQELVTQVRKQMLRHGEVSRVDWFLGESAPSFYYNLMTRRKNASYYAQGLVTIDDAKNVRPLIHRLQEELDEHYPQARPIVRQLEQGPPFEAPLEIRLFGPDLDVLKEYGDQVRAILSRLPDVTHTRSGLSETSPTIALTVNEEEARLAGLDHATIARQLQQSLEGSMGGEVIEATERLPVRVRLTSSRRADLTRVASLELLPDFASYPTIQNGLAASSADYQPIPLTALSEIRVLPTAAAISHYNGRRTNEIHAFITAGQLPSSILTGFREAMAAEGFSLPTGFRFEFGGEAAKRDDAVGDLMANVGVLAVLMLATLVMSFRSFRLAGLILVVATLSVGLGLGSIWVCGFPFGFMAIVGTMGLIGVAINDAIVVLAGIREDESARAGDSDAIQAVVFRSTRHVLATTLTTMAGFTPLLIAGGEFWPPLAITIAGGVSGATVLALILVPAAYVLLMRRHATFFYNP